MTANEHPQKIKSTAVPNIWVVFAPYWPYHANGRLGINEAAKYVVSNTLSKHNWKNSILTKNDVTGEIKKLKMQDGPDLKVYGSSKLVQTLLQHDLVDEL